MTHLASKVHTNNFKNVDQDASNTNLCVNISTLLFLINCDRTIVRFFYLYRLYFVDGPYGIFVFQIHFEAFQNEI